MLKQLSSVRCDDVYIILDSYYDRELNRLSYIGITLDGTVVIRKVGNDIDESHPGPMLGPIGPKYTYLITSDDSYSSISMWYNELICIDSNLSTGEQSIEEYPIPEYITYESIHVYEGIWYHVDVRYDRIIVSNLLTGEILLSLDKIDPMEDDVNYRFISIFPYSNSYVILAEKDTEYQLYLVEGNRMLLLPYPGRYYINCVIGDLLLITYDMMTRVDETNSSIFFNPLTNESLLLFDPTDIHVHEAWVDGNVLIVFRINNQVTTYELTEGPYS